MFILSFIAIIISYKTYKSKMYMQSKCNGFYPTGT
nr:MAG TPA: hypothetical protein [Crassvirales sp.]